MPSTLVFLLHINFSLFYTAAAATLLVADGSVKLISNGPIILTGFSALNKLLGREVYTSQDQLGGPQVSWLFHFGFAGIMCYGSSFGCATSFAGEVTMEDSRCANAVVGMMVTQVGEPKGKEKEHWIFSPPVILSPS